MRAIELCLYLALPLFCGGTLFRCHRLTECSRNAGVVFLVELRTVLLKLIVDRPELRRDVALLLLVTLASGKSNDNEEY
jgi:hypothetical protein